MNATSLVSKTLDALMESILEANAGTFLPPQEELSKALGVSRTVLREALSRLEYLKVISVRPKIGTKINHSNDWLVVNVDVLKWRKRLENSKEA